MWKYYFQNTKGLIFVVDSSDQDRLELARETLHGIISYEDMRGFIKNNQDVPILIFANKQDMSNLSVQDMEIKLNLNELRG